MNRFWAFVKKEFWHILRDRRTLLVLLGMPVAQVLIFGYAVTNEFRNANIAVLDQAHDDLSTELIYKLTASGHLRLATSVKDEKDIHAAFKAGTIKLAVVIPPRFATNLQREGRSTVQLLADGSEPNYASTLVAYANQMIADFQRERLAVAGGFLPSVNVSTRMLYNPELRSAYLFVPGVMALVLMLISAMMTSLTIAREKELGTMELLLVSPLHPLLIVVGKVTPYVLLAFLDGVLILTVGVLVFGVPIQGSLLLLLAMSVLYVLAALSLGILISTRAKTQQAAMMGSLVSLMLPTVLLSDFIFPLASMPLPLQVLGNVIPARWFIAILRDVMLKGVGWGYVWQEAAILGGMSLVFLVAAMKNFKVRLE
ncbi:MAG: multidrug ABC transporter permease [Saprospirales bacterium]|nr:multidrug ABC transporter permease [Saprospirales bacterium]